MSFGKGWGLPRNGKTNPTTASSASPSSVDVPAPLPPSALQTPEAMATLQPRVVAPPVAAPSVTAAVTVKALPESVGRQASPATLTAKRLTPTLSRSASKSPLNQWEELKNRIHRRLIDEIDVSRLSGTGPEDDQLLQKTVRQAIEQLVTEEVPSGLSSVERNRLIEDLMNETTGLGPLEYLLKDDTITEIMINGPQHVFVERKGQLLQSEVVFKDNGHLLQIIDRIVSAVGRRVDETQPLCDARLRDGSRFNCVIPPLALDGPLVTIRKFSKKPLTIDKLIEYGSLTSKAANLLKSFVEGHLNIVISGGTGSGKTTLLNVLSSFIPEGDRIVTIEDTAELQLMQSHVARMETRPPNLEGKGEITMRDLVKNALRMRPERIVVGECRAGEALDMLQAMNTGHDGSLTTLHANTPRDAVRRLETMVMMAGYDLPQRAIREQIASAIHVIIQASRLSDGSRRVMNVTEILGMEGDVILMQDVFKFEQRGVDDDGKAIGELKYTGIRPRFLETLLSRGVDVDMALFERG